MHTERAKSTATYTIDVNGALREIERLTKVIELTHSHRVTMAVSAAFNIPTTEINGRSLNHRTCLARAMVYMIMRDRYAYTPGDIAAMFTRDKSTIHRALQLIDGLIGVDKGLTALRGDVMRLIE